jgi:membrane-anchored protein YejM (alkaline phosphatase superfamily)
VIVLSLLSFLIKTKKQFWVLPSFLADEWREDKLVYSTVNTVPEFMKGAEGLLLYSPPEEGWLPKADGVVDSSATPHQKIQPPRPSGTPPLEGNIKTPIILITVESLSGFYLKKNALQMPYFQSLAKKGLQSTCHIAPCSLTNNAFRHIYQHSYVKSDFSYLRQLKNYQPIFVTSQKSTEFNLDALLHTIGFEVILDNVSLSQKTSARLSDPEFFERIPALIQEKLDTTRAPFIHIMNNQTHGPYFTYSEKIVDRQKRYEKAIEETDTTLQKLMPSLSAFIDMDNALIIFTGDHGESFGEESYLSHANAIIQPQIEVPLAIYHRNITPHTISLSNHFDLFPTIAEILSLDLPLSMLGQSLLQGKSTGCLVHSETRFGNTPSSFGYVGENKKWHIDRLLDKYELRNLQDEILEQLEGKTRQELVDVLATALQDRSLVF